MFLLYLYHRSYIIDILRNNLISQANLKLIENLKGKRTLKYNSCAFEKYEYGVLVVVTLNQLFVRDFYTEMNFSKNEVVSGKTQFLMVGPFCTRNSICLKISF